MSNYIFIDLDLGDVSFGYEVKLGGGKTRQPTVDGKAISNVRVTERGAEMWLFVKNDEKMSEQQPGQGEEHDSGRPLVEAEAEKHQETTFVHGITDESVRSNRYE